jgi:hypothetical protein
MSLRCDIDMDKPLEVFYAERRLTDSNEFKARCLVGLCLTLSDAGNWRPKKKHRLFISRMTADVAWANGTDGGFVRGHDGV